MAKDSNFEKDNLTKKNHIKKMSFEDAFEKLQKIVDKLDSGNVSLSETVRFFEEAVMLKQHCQSILKSFQLKVEQITSKNNDEEIEISEIKF